VKRNGNGPVVAIDISRSAIDIDGHGHNWRIDEPSLQGSHYRVRITRGSADQHACIDCGRQAIHWSQIRGTTGYDPSHYEPRCRSCHNKYDWDTLNVTKLSPAKVTEIRTLWATDNYYQRELAELFGVTQSTISVIVNNKTWSKT
jgi:hypothetical protein